MEAKYLDLLAGIAKVLDYKDLLQTDISRFYFPEAHGIQAEINDKIQMEWLRVLQNSASFAVVNKEEDKSS
jgi:hypothetical protein